jgi:hypothetical protein
LVTSIAAHQVHAGLFGPKDRNQWSDEEGQTVSRLMDAFGPGCSLTGGVATDAISVVRSLSDVMNAAAKDPNCGSLVGAVSSLQASQLQATSLWPTSNEDAYNEAQKNYLSYEKQKEQLLLLLATETDGDVRKDLQAQLRSIQVEMAGSDGASVAAEESDRRSRKNEAIRVLVSATNLAMEQALSNQQCWADKPDFLRQIVGLGSAVGYSAAAIAPASTVALAMGAGLQLVGGFWDFIRRLATQKKVSTFTKALDPISLTCALEKMNQIYCAARDSQNTLNVFSKAGTSLSQDPVWQGIRLARRELPVLITWLNKLKSGAGSVSTPEDAQKINNIEYKKQLLEQSPRYFQGYLAKYRPLYLQVTDPDARFGFLRDFITSLSNAFCPDYGSGSSGMVSSNPLCGINSTDFAPFYLLGLSRGQYLQLRSKYQGLLFSQLDLQLFAREGILVDIDIDQVEPRFVRWHDLAKQRIDAEASMVLGDDLKLVFEEASPQKDSDKLRLSPYTAAKKITDYLELTNPQVSSVGFELEVVNALKAVTSILDEVAKGAKSPKDGRDGIYVATNLSVGTLYLQNRIQYVLRQQLESLILYQGDVPLQALAANDYIQDLYSYYRADSLEIIRRKSLTAQATIQRSIDPFISFFAQPLQESLNTLDSQAKKYKEGPGGPNYEMKMTLCFYLLGASSWNAGLDLSPCIGVVGKPVFANGYSTPAFGKGLFDKPYEDRACILRDFARRNQILQTSMGLQKKKKKLVFQ